MVIRDYEAFVAPVASGAETATATATAGDDAADVRWVSDAEADAMQARGEITGGLLAALRSWR